MNNNTFPYEVKEKSSNFNASCMFTGGPLYEGDIEDYKGSPHIMCPWHGYMFSLENGRSEIGIMVRSDALLAVYYLVHGNQSVQLFLTLAMIKQKQGCQSKLYKLYHKK